MFWEVCSQVRCFIGVHKTSLCKVVFLCFTVLPTETHPHSSPPTVHGLLFPYLYTSLCWGSPSRTVSYLRVLFLRVNECKGRCPGPGRGRRTTSSGGKGELPRLIRTVVGHPWVVGRLVPGSGDTPNGRTGTLDLLSTLLRKTLFRLRWCKLEREVKSPKGVDYGGCRSPTQGSTRSPPPFRLVTQPKVSKVVILQIY